MAKKSKKMSKKKSLSNIKNLQIEPLRGMFKT